MAGIDYYSCDVCGAKTFYDAGLQYNTPRGDTPRYNPVSGKVWPSGNVGWMVVLCVGCSEKYNVDVVDRLTGESV